MRESEEIQEQIEKIIEQGKLVLVEGIKDKRALEQLGITRIVTLRRRALYKVVEDIVNKTKDCIILTDLDKEGKKLYKTINSELTQRGVRIDKHFRNFLFKKTKLRQIEGIANYKERIKSFIF
jgi:5S rRNA maturation endonuclease (ribonuclease M5)